MEKLKSEEVEALHNLRRRLSREVGGAIRTASVGSMSHIKDHGLVFKIRMEDATWAISALESLLCKHAEVP